MLDKVHIQPDSTTRENKNKLGVVLCIWLDEIGLVKEIRLSLNPVG